MRHDIFKVIAALALIALPTAVTAAPSAQARYDAAIAGAKGAMMADPRAALAQADQATAAATALPGERDAGQAEATARWLAGEATARLDRPRDALAILQQANALAARHAPHSKLVGDILLSRGWAEGAMGSVQAALQDYQAAYGLFRSIGEVRGQAKALQNIGSIYHDAGDDQRSLNYYAQVADISKSDPMINLVAHNNLGETLKTLGRFRESEQQYLLAIRAARALKSGSLEARIYPNLASAQLANGEVDAAETSARRALALASGAEAAEERPFIYGVLAQIAFRRGDLAEAEKLIARTFAHVDLSKTPLPFRDFHRTAADIYSKADQPALAFQHLRAYKRLDDNIRALAASTNAALMAAQFDFANQQLNISRLREGQTRRDAMLQQSREHLKTVVFSLLLGAAALLSAILFTSFLSLRRSRNQVREANDQLSETNTSLEKALKVKNEFLATTSHEIRTPLNGILGMTQVILADLSTDAKTRDRVGVVHSAGQTMKALVDDILDLAKIETGALVVQRGPMDIVRLLEDAVRFWRGAAEAKGLALEAAIDLPRQIVCDENRLRQIIFNVMSNAVKFTGRGTICLRAHSKDDSFVIEIEDTGIGIALDQQELIFEKFHQVDGGTSRQYAGTGLGLAISRNLTDALDGDISVRSALGEGATFMIRLPLEVVATPDDAPVHAGGKADFDLILLLDPNPLTQRLAAKSLKSVSANIQPIVALEEATDRLGKEGVGLVLVQADAFDTERQRLVDLTQQAQANGAGCLMIGSFPDQAERAQLEKNGATILSKPVPPQLVISTATALLGIERASAAPLAPAA